MILTLVQRGIIGMLEELFKQYGCDKASKHKYHTVYEPDFEPLRDKEINILEVGIFKGDSIKVWLDYFPKATVYGIDVFTRISSKDIAVLEHERVKWLKADSTSYGVVNSIRKEWPRIRFDIIIDDGLHTPEANTKTLNNLYPLLKKEGSYYVEDVWPLDIMTTKQLEHPWILKKPSVYNILEMNKFLKSIEDKNAKRYDLRSISGEPDSYIIRLQ